VNIKILLNIQYSYEIHCAVNIKCSNSPRPRSFNGCWRTCAPCPSVEIGRVQQEPKAAAKHRGYTAMIGLQAGSQALTLLVEERKTVYPRDVQQLVWQLRSLGIGAPEATGGAEMVPLLAAESLSAGAKDLLQAEQIAYFDSGGSLFLPAANAYVFIDKPSPKGKASEMRSLFTGRRAQAIHTMLMQHEEWFGVTDLAERAQVSAGTASGILSELEKFEWADARGLGPRKQRQLRAPGAVLDAWAKEVTGARSPQLRRYFVPGVNKAEALVDRVGEAFDGHDVDYAISHEAAAQRYAPFLSTVAQVRSRVLVVPRLEDALTALEARPVSEGANLALIEARSPGDLLFRNRLGNAWLASPIHVYLDLLQGEGRAKEMAAHLRQERIGF
jgi:hypothetical protein